MAEESFYTDKVTEYRKNSRFPTLSRYRDLINFLKNVFSDGIVTGQITAGFGTKNSGRTLVKSFVSLFYCC